MTSFILQSVQDRPTSYPALDGSGSRADLSASASASGTYSHAHAHGRKKGEDGTPRPGSCPFCAIAVAKGHAWRVYEDDDVIAFLDIYPLRTGHTLLCPKRHYARLSDLPPELGAAMGRALPKVTRAITEATGNKDLNVVCNQGYAQDVQHVHWHLIPAPIFAHEQRIDTAKAEKTALKTAGSGRKSALASATSSAGSGGRCVNAGKPLGGGQEGGAAAAEPPTQSWLIRREGHRREFLEDDEADELVDKIRSRL